MYKNICAIVVAISCVAALSGCGGSSDSSSSNDGSGGNGGGSGTGSHASSSSASDAENPESSDPEIDSEATQFYFSYDDSASTAARDLTFAAIANGNKPDSSWGRPYEFLNAETLGHFNEVELEPFSVSMGLYPADSEELPVVREFDGSLYALGVTVSGPTLTKQERPAAVLTLLVDISGSMLAPYATETAGDMETLMDVTKYGLSQLTAALKEGDIVNLVTFNKGAQTVLEGWQFDADDATFLSRIEAIEANGSTNLNAGVQLAYEVAREHYDSTKANRVVILTDAYANAGEVDASVIADNTVINGLEGIHFAGVGIGSDFNDAFLRELTDIGKSVYSAVVTPADAQRVFTEGFMRFVDSAVTDVEFSLTYPQAFDQLQSASEEISENEDDVQSTNFAYNSEQFFFELFSSEETALDDEQFTLTITFKDAQGDDQELTLTRSVAELSQTGAEHIKTAAAVTALAQLVAGQLSCSEVTNSGFYQQGLNHAIFTQYKNAIAQYCKL